MARADACRAVMRFFDSRSFHKEERTNYVSQ